MSLQSGPIASSRVTVPPIVNPPSESEQIAQVRQRLLQRAEIDPARVRVVRAPLRISPLGAHIDHQLGVVTGMTIDRSILLAYAPTDDGRVEVESLDFQPPTAFALDNVPSFQRGDRANYVRGAALALQQQHRLRRGLIGVIGGDMPIGGLSSSAAVTVAYLLALEAANDLELTAHENVDLCQYTENRYIGLKNGILDQSVILHSRHDHLTRIDCETVTVDNVPTQLPSTALRDQFGVLVVYSGVTHALTGTDYNQRVAQCRDAAATLLARSGQSAPEDVRLRHVAPELFVEYGKTLDVLQARRAQHFFGEMDRVARGVSAWQAGDLVEMGRLVTASGESSIKWYECGSPQLVTLYEILADTPGVLGTRFSGAGFRGNCLALIDPAQFEAVAEAVHRRYPAAHPEIADAVQHPSLSSGRERRVTSRLGGRVGRVQGVVLAAGKGTRLLPLTQTRTKAMVPVVGKPLVARVVDTLIANDVRDLVFVVSPDDAAIRDYFGDGSHLGIAVRYVAQTERRGMAHALGLAAPWLTGPFVMSACDNLVAADHVGELIDTHRRYAAAATLSLMPIDIAKASSTGIVVWEPPSVRRIVEKPSPAEAPSNISSLPLYVFDRTVLDVLPRVQPSARGEYELQDAIQLLIDETGAVVGAITPTRMQVTNAADLLALNLHYLAQDPARQVVGAAEIGAAVELVPPVVIEDDVRIGSHCTIGPRVYLERGVTVGDHTQLQEVVALAGTTLPPGVTVTNRLLAPDLPIDAN